MKILDVSAGNRMIWANRRHPDATYVDIRPEVAPDLVADSRALPFEPATFDLAVFDPPHMNLGVGSRMAQSYGHHTTAEIRDIVAGTSRELARVLVGHGLLAFKWNDHDQRLERILGLLPEFEPLVCHGLTVAGRHPSQSYWALLRRR